MAVLLLLLSGGCARAPTEGYGEAVVVVGVELHDDAVRVREAHVWQGGHGVPSRELDLEWIPGSFPLRTVLSVERAAIDDVEVPMTVRRYDDWHDIDLPYESEAGARHRLDLEYSLEGAWRPGQEGTDVLFMQQVGPRDPRTVRQVSLRVTAPADASLGLFVAPGYVPYERVELERSGEPEDGAQVWVAHLGASEPEQPLFWRLGVRSETYRPGTPPYLATLARQSGTVPWALAVALVLALVLRFMPAHVVIAGTRLTHLGILAVAIWEVAGEQALYWWGESALPGRQPSEAIVEVVGNAGLSVLLVVYLWEQDRGLRSRSAEAYVREVALPLSLTLAWPMLSVRTSYLMLPLLGLPALLAWLRPSVALAMGADLHRVVEVVRTRGRVSMEELAGALGLRLSALHDLLARHPSLPIVVERNEHEVLSASAAALRDDLRVCPGCGGGTHVTGQDLLACPYCEREYASKERPEPMAPVPLLVRSIAGLLRILGRGLVGWAILVGSAIVLMGMLGDDDVPLIGALLVLGMFVLMAHGLRVLLQRLATGLEAGRGYVWLMAGLGLGAPLVVPAIVLWRARSPRVRLHFGRFDVAGLARELDERGQLSIDELAQRLRTRWDEAFDVAVHLCGSGTLDAVLDRSELRVIARGRLRELATAGTCHQCGGIVGVVDGTVQCHYCGTTAAA